MLMLGIWYVVKILEREYMSGFESLESSDADAEDTDSMAEQNEPKTITLTVTYEDGRADEYTIETDAEYLKEAIETTVTLEGTQGDYGFNVTAVNGVEAEFTAGSDAYWGIYVNGEYGTYAMTLSQWRTGIAFGLTYETYAD